MSFIRRKLLRGEPFNATTLAAVLEVSTKTIHRDLDFMRNALNYEFEYDAASNSFIGKPSVITTL